MREREDKVVYIEMVVKMQDSSGYTKIILATYFNRCLFLSLSLQSQIDEREQVIKD